MGGQTRQHQNQRRRQPGLRVHGLDVSPSNKCSGRDSNAVQTVIIVGFKCTESMYERQAATSGANGGSSSACSLENGILSGRKIFKQIQLLVIQAAGDKLGDESVEMTLNCKMLLCVHPRELFLYLCLIACAVLLPFIADVADILQKYSNQLSWLRN